jgi:glycosyltransferase involved in cell wall biosynthesis
VSTLGVVVTTIGRIESLERLFRSIADQTVQCDSFTVADQSRGDLVRQLVEAWRDVLPISVVTSEGGIAAGRNAALSALGDVEIVAFPDDDVWYAPKTLEMVTRVFRESSASIVSGRLVAPDGSPVRLAWRDSAGQLNKRTVWTSLIEPTMFCRRGLFDEVGAFNPQLGTGSPTPWQSGEGTDLVLRALNAGHVVQYDPIITVFEDVDHWSDRRVYRLKVRKYARGTGRVLRANHGLIHTCLSVLRACGAVCLALIRLDYESGGQRAQAAIGRAEGCFGRTFPFSRI